MIHTVIRYREIGKVFGEIVDHTTVDMVVPVHEGGGCVVDVKDL